MNDTLPTGPKIYFGVKEVKDLTDDELWAAIHSVAGIENFRFDKLKDRRIDKNGHRLNKIFKANPPVENPNYTKLVDELTKEFKMRNL